MEYERIPAAPGWGCIEYHLNGETLRTCWEDEHNFNFTIDMATKKGRTTSEKVLALIKTLR